ncbi:MAG: DUF885 family protein [Rudaea sp.]|uniref:DUF885 domain-containing protein n=1 Tax=Rudaea sp. TaxID=2136325 RepID=UPI0039E5176C
MPRIAFKPLFLAVAVACGASSAAHAADDVAARVKALNALLAEQWEYTLKHQPEFATMLGDYRYNDQWSDASPAAAQQQKKDNEAFLARFKAIDTSGFGEQDKLNQQLMVRQLGDNIRATDLKLNEMPLDQFNGVHLILPQLVSMAPFDTTKQYEDYLARLDKLPALFDQLTETLRQGERDKLMPPRYLLEKEVVAQIRSIAAPAGAANVFARPVAKFPDAVPEAERKRLHDAIVKAVDTKVRPAYEKLAAFVEKDYAPKGRTEPGIWALPNGDALYKFDIEQQTTTDKSPQEIHDLGLAEVKRIEGEQLKIAQKMGYRDLPGFRAALAKDPKTHATSREQMLDLYRKYIAGMQPKLPQSFGLLPKTRLEVEAVPEYAEKDASTQYLQGTPDGKRPGRVQVNTYDFANQSLLDIETTAYHEGVPGHHMQISIAQTLPGLPPFRQQAGYTAYIEGWALYAERLGEELGFYQDPLSYYGHLDDELLRANRLVLDTGVHYKHWTRQQMVDWFHAHSAQAEPMVQSETDRYIVMPGQALAYKIGQLKILELRAKAKKELGDKFDIRAFHDEILDGGALPLDVLETRVDGWIARTKAQAPKAS